MTKAEKSEFYNELRHVKDDLLFCNGYKDGYVSLPKYHGWIDGMVGHIYPEPIDHHHEWGLYHDVRERPSIYLRFMISMNIQFEAWGGKAYSPLCIRSSLSAKYIKLDTAALVDMLVTNEELKDMAIVLGLPKLKTKGQLLGSSSLLVGETLSKEASFYYKTRLWKYFVKFNTNKYTTHLLKRGHYVFDNSILTDGVGVSVLQVRSDRVGYCCKANNSVALKYVPEDVPYLSELSPSELDHLQQHSTAVGGDPGKDNIICMTDENGVTIRYTSQQRAMECRHKKNKKAMVSMKKAFICRNGKTVEVNEQTIQYNARTCVYDNFIHYIGSRRALEQQVSEAMYSKLTPRKLRFSAQVHTTQSEDRLLNKIAKTFKTTEKHEVTIAWGNWSQHQQMRNCIPTPGIGLRKRLARKGKALGVWIGRVHEAYSSCTCHDCHSRTGYFKTRTFIKNEKSHTRDIHGLLRCQNESCSRLWNRDVLGSTNIQEIASAVLRSEPRPIHFTAGHSAHAQA
jgi:hypothetical protein